MKILLTILATLILFVIAGMIWARTASRPELGIQDGKLLPLPNTPNCVATQSGNTNQKMSPLSYSDNRETAQSRLIKILNQLPNTTLVTNEPGYIWVIFRSSFFGFPDDVEFQFIDNEIHFRAAARLGRSDFGVNRKRMNTIKQLFEQ